MAETGTRKRKNAQNIEDLQGIFKDNQKMLKTVDENVSKAFGAIEAKIESSKVVVEHGLSGVITRQKELEIGFAEVKDQLRTLAELKQELAKLNQTTNANKQTLQTMADKQTALTASVLTKADKSKIGKQIRPHYHEHKYMTKAQVSGFLPADISLEKLAASISHALVVIRGGRSTDNANFKNNVKEFFPGNTLADYLKATEEAKHHIQTLLAARIYAKAVQHTPVDLDWMDTLVCRYVIVSGQYEKYRQDHTVDVIPMLQAKPYWRNLWGELKKEYPPLNDIAPMPTGANEEL